MDFEPSQANDIFGPLLIEQALSDVPVFGPQKVDTKALVATTLAGGAEERLVAEVSNGTAPSVLFETASSIADKLKALRLASRQGKNEPEEPLLSQLERHAKLLIETRDMAGLSSKERFAVDHTMLLRAQEGYRFDFVKNQKIVADDPWLQDVWVWVAGELLQCITKGAQLLTALHRRRRRCSRRRHDVAPPGYRLHGSPHGVDQRPW
jgi:WD repeat-containing protein mio